VINDWQKNCLPVSMANSVSSNVNSSESLQIQWNYTCGSVADFKMPRFEIYSMFTSKSGQGFSYLSGNMTLSLFQNYQAGNSLVMASLPNSGLLYGICYTDDPCQSIEMRNTSSFSMLSNQSVTSSPSPSSVNFTVTLGWSWFESFLTKDQSFLASIGYCSDLFFGFDVGNPSDPITQAYNVTISLSSSFILSPLTLRIAGGKVCPSVSSKDTLIIPIQSVDNKWDYTLENMMHGRWWMLIETSPTNKNSFTILYTEKPTYSDANCDYLNGWCSPQIPDQESSTGNDNKVLIIVLCTLSGVVLLVLIGVILLRYRKSRQAGYQRVN